MILEVFGKPWMMTEGSLKTLVAIASRDAFFADVRKQALEARDGAPLKNARGAAYTRGTVAVIPVVGPLIRHADMFSDISGATSYAALRKDLQTALDDSSVRSILFNIDSPGGEANGCFELADAIYAARAIKPVHAYVGGTGASAAYAIASACETITCAQSAELGSIGVRAGFLDDRRALDAVGVKEWVFVSSQSPFKAFDVEVEDDRARLQVVLDDLAQVFVGQVARGRDVGVAEVLENFGKGDVMVGARAIAAGLADELGDFESCLAALDQQQPAVGALRAAAKEKRMHVKADTQTPAQAASMSDQKCDACGTAMKGGCYCKSCFDADDDDDEDDEMASALGMTPKATKAERTARAAALVDLEKHFCEMAGANTAAEARGKIATALADAAAATTLRTELAAAKADGIRRDLRATLEAGIDAKKLSLGTIQKSMAIVLRGEQKAAWGAAMGSLETVSRDTVIEAACSVGISADDLTAISEFAKSAAPFAAEPAMEPKRNSAEESAELNELDQTIKAAADATRKSLDRGLRAAPTK